jgi:hypothetical protein
MLHRITKNAGYVWKNVVQGVAAKGAAEKMLPDDGMANAVSVDDAAVPTR